MIEKLVLLNGKTRNLFFCQMHLVSNLKAAVRGGRKNKDRADVRPPAIARSYNTYMGGFDMMDRLISYYRISTRTKKWTMRVFVYFLNMATCNAWIMYIRH
ncbi:piggyBac transposable element-derived protein 3 [Trichonephila clavata]|uniref:PiggyBac transposable element-derived protein 3 n=1 Tax=Trichonephila clavata TaxID=2740835 RepID=A0A8X6M481_TRICU|nr:piggyBac transposable element-derived protein 3 [Trichonephila clavata]